MDPSPDDFYDLEDAYPMTKLQVGMIFHSSYSPDTAIYHDIFSYHLLTPFEEHALSGAVQQLIEHHAILRTSFDINSFSEPLQLIHRKLSLPFQIEDLRLFPAKEQEQIILSWIEAEKKNNIDWERPPLFRFQIHRRSEKTLQLTLSFHHAILDGWSVASLLTELFHRYLLLLGKEVPPLEPPPTTTFRDFVALEQQALKNPASRSYWIQNLGDYERANMPGWPPKGTKIGNNTVQNWEVSIPPEVSADLQQLANSIGVPLKSILLAAHLKVLSLFSGRRDIITGLVSHGRLEMTGGDRVLGLFLNTLPLRVKLNGGTWIDLIGQVFEAEQDALPYHRYPLSEIQRSLGGQPLFATAFNFMHFHVYQSLHSFSEIQILGGHVFEDTNFPFFCDFALDVSTSNIRLMLSCDSIELFRSQIQAIGRCYAHVLMTMTTRPNERYETYSPPLIEEYNQLLEAFNTNKTDDTSDQCIHTLFERQVEQTPDAIALVFEDTCMSYQELDTRANQLACYLHRLGIGPEIMVGLYIDRSLAMVIALLGILKAGGVYVPFDSATPGERLAFLIQDSHVAMIITQDRLAPALQEYSVPVLCLDGSWEQISQENQGGPGSRAIPRNLAYVIYTSGSTGYPKGVTIEQQALLNHCRYFIRSFNFQANDRVLQFASISFDAAGEEIFPPLLSGGTLVLRPVEIMNPLHFTHFLAEYGLTFVDLPTAYWHLWVSQIASATTFLPSSLRVVIIGGEEAFSVKWKSWQQNSTNTVRLVNTYGPTEATITCTIFESKGAQIGLETRTVPIGNALPNIQTRVLDSYLQPVPIGTPGELYIGGAGLARGYLGRPNLTAEKFIPDPFSKIPGSRLYKTGDIVRYLPDGTIEFLGRFDHQVKIRGFRIELGEIETALAQHALVEQAVTIVKTDASGNKHLVAYITLAGKEVPVASELLRFLKKKLPYYILPEGFVLMDSFPLSPTGKINRQELPTLALSRLEITKIFIPPRTLVEKKLADIWTQMLGLEQVSIYDTFLDSGGHSLLAMHFIHQIREIFHVELPLRHLLDTTTFADIAAIIDQMQAAQMMVPEIPVLISDLEQRYHPFPLSEIQQVYWVGQSGLFAPGTCRATICMEYRVLRVDTLFLNRLNHALQQMIARHEMLRVTVLPNGQQQILAHVPPYQVQVVDMRSYEDHRIQSELEKIREALDTQQGAQDQWPLFDFCAYLINDQEVRLFIRIDAILMDGRSRGIFLQELACLLENPDAGASLPVLECSYRDYVLTWANFAHSKTAQRHAEYWLGRLAEIPPGPELPLLCDVSPRTPCHFLNLDAILLEADDWSRLKERASQAGLTPTSIASAAFAEVLSLWSRNQDFTLSLMSSYRPPFHPGIQNIIANFTTIYLLSVKSSADPFAKRAKALQDQLIASLEHPYFSGIQVLRALQRQQGGSAKAFIPVLFNSLLEYNALARKSENQRITSFGPYPVEELYANAFMPQVLLVPTVSENAEGVLLCNWQAMKDVLPVNLIKDLNGVYILFLQYLSTDSDWSTIPWSQIAPGRLPSMFSHENAKDGRMTLPVELQSTPAQPALLTPRNPLELRMQELWEEILEQRPVGMRDNFFRLGGDSFKLVLLIAKIQQIFGERLSTRAIFAETTVESFAHELQTLLSQRDT